MAAAVVTICLAFVGYGSRGASRHLERIDAFG
jgi:hypothetical protein